MPAHIIAIVNQKGGVGKTTTAVNLSACLAASGRQVLLCDMDPQANATSGLGIDKHGPERTIYDVLIGEATLEQVLWDTGIERLALAPAASDLVGAEIELVEADQRERRLADALAPVARLFEYIFIDCPPALNLLTINALTAATEVLVPLQCEYFALEGLSELTNTIERVQQHLNPALSIHGILLTMYQHTNLATQVADDVRSHFGERVYQTVIPRNITLAEAPSFGQPVIYYDLRSAGAKAYLELAREMAAHG